MQSPTQFPEESPPPSSESRVRIVVVLGIIALLVGGGYLLDRITAPAPLDNIAALSSGTLVSSTMQAKDPTTAPTYLPKPTSATKTTRSSTTTTKPTVPTTTQDPREAYEQQRQAVLSVYAQKIDETEQELAALQQAYVIDSADLKMKWHSGQLAYQAYITKQEQLDRDHELYKQALIQQRTSFLEEQETALRDLALQYDYPYEAP